jgi:hypothetical protein
MRVFVWILFLNGHLDLICVGLGEVSRKKQTPFKDTCLRAIGVDFGIMLPTPHFFSGERK